MTNESLLAALLRDRAGEGCYVIDRSCVVSAELGGFALFQRCRRQRALQSSLFGPY
jgi:hypothetical protein